MTTLFFDIETLPAPENKFPLLQRLHQEKLAEEATWPTKRTPEDWDTFLRNTALNGAFGQVCCIAVIKERDGQEVSRATLHGDEAEILRTFWKGCSDVNLFVGHGIRFFDLRFLMQRSLMHGVPFKPVPLKKFSDFPVYDTMDQWMFYDGTIKLHDLALAFGLASPKDQGIDGSQVYDFYLAGKQQDIYDYCMRDVETVRSVYKRLKNSQSVTTFPTTSPSLYS